MTIAMGHTVYYLFGRPGRSFGTVGESTSTMDAETFPGDMAEGSYDNGQIFECFDGQMENMQQLEQETDEKDPFSLKCRIPLPNAYGGPYNLFDSSNFIKRRNERERTRVRNVNEGFERLRNHLPLHPDQRERRLSKSETLRMAIAYIRHLEQLLAGME